VVPASQVSLSGEMGRIQIDFSDTFFHQLIVPAGRNKTNGLDHCTQRKAASDSLP
jgi:hypothetical protein